MPKTPIGGGAKKVLYTLQTVNRIGLLSSGKALSSKNTCKACAFGMGGQAGGMTNELNEFPSVCNKSVQAQSTDIQTPIPEQIFAHSIEELRELTDKQIEHLGRLNTPLYKSKDATHYQPVSWDWALQHSQTQLLNTQAERSFFYSSGRSSNEAGFLFQLLARAYGSNHINNCSYYCHQATGVGLSSTIGTGTATIELADLSGSDCIIVIGANPSSNHPRFIHQLKACRDRGGQVIVINPAKEPGLVKFAVPKSPRSMIAGGTDIASTYIQPNIGGDLALLTGVAKACYELNAVNNEFIGQFTENSNSYKEYLKNCDWQEISEYSGLSKADIQDLAKRFITSNNTVFAWGMGVTHHQHGSATVEAIANLALLRGMIGRPNAGLLPLRGHSNVQGVGTIGVKPILPDEVIKKIEQYCGMKAPTFEGLDTLACLEAAANHQMDAALIMGGNLYAASPQTEWANKALNNIKFKCYLSTTLNRGHLMGNESSEQIILPVCARDEEPQATTQESMFNYVRLSDGGIKRLDNVRSEVHILADLGLLIAEKSGVDFEKFKHYSTIREAIAASIPGMEDLKDIAIAKQEFHIKGRLLHNPQFKTNNGKATFKFEQLSTHQFYQNRQQDYPLTLATVRSEGQFNSIIYEETDSYRYNAPRNAIFMNTSDMTALQLSHGELVSVISKHGTMENAIIQNFDISKGSVMAYYPEANVLTGREHDPRSKTPNFKSISVKIIKKTAHI